MVDFAGIEPTFIPCIVLLRHKLCLYSRLSTSSWDHRLRTRLRHRPNSVRKVTPAGMLRGQVLQQQRHDVTRPSRIPLLLVEDRQVKVRIECTGSKKVRLWEDLPWQS